MRNKIIIFLIVLLPLSNLSQEKELFDLIITDENATPQLLPERMIFTQRIFWGEKGILRKTNQGKQANQKNYNLISQNFYLIIDNKILLN